MRPGTHIDKLPDDDPKKRVGQLIGETVTSGVDFLRSVFPNEAVQKLMKLVWDIIGHKITPIALGPQVPSISLAVFGSPALPQAAIFLPHNWLDDVKADPVLQMGALVFVGSQALDFYNQKVGRAPAQGPESVRRARAYEAEYLLTVKKMGPQTKFNDYQKKVLDDFPEGILTPAIRDLLYQSREFVPPA